MNRQYTNPPLREAVCEFRFQEGEAWDQAIPGLIYAAMRAQFPRRLSTAQSQVVASSGMQSLEGSFPQPPQFELQLIREEPFRFWREEDESGYIGVAPYRLSVHHFNPYPSWKRYREIIVQGVRNYLEVVEPSQIQRIGLRYINDIDLGEGGYTLEDFFNFYPFVGSNIPQDLSFFHCMVQAEFENGRDLLTLQIASLPQTVGDNVGVTLDLDYFLARPGAIGMDSIQDWLEVAHTNLGTTFEGCLKDSVRELFQ